MAEKIVSGDEVVVLRGRDKGARGRVRENRPREDRVIVEGVNIVKRHQKGVPGVRQAGIIDLEAPMHASKVMLICPSCNHPTRVGFRVNDEGRKVRYCKRCDATIERPKR